MSSRHKQSQRQGIFDTKTAIQIFTVFHDRLEMDTEFACDLLAAFTGSDQNGDPFLSFGQPAEPDYRTFIFFRRSSDRPARPYWTHLFCVHQAGTVFFDRAGTDTQMKRDLLATDAFHRKIENFLLARGQKQSFLHDFPPCHCRWLNIPKRIFTGKTIMQGRIYIYR